MVDYEVKVGDALRSFVQVFWGRPTIELCDKETFTLTRGAILVTESVIEEILMHEILHIVLSELEGWRASYGLDKVVGWFLSCGRWGIDFKGRRLS